MIALSHCKTLEIFQKTVLAPHDLPIYFWAWFHAFWAQLAVATNHVFSINFLQENKTLQTLNLNKNKIGDAGARAIASALKVVLGAQILKFRLETCFLFSFIVIPKPFHRRRSYPRHKLILLTLSRTFHFKLPCILSLVSSPANPSLLLFILN